MDFKQKILLFLTFFGLFLLVYKPHFSYPYPFHVDEWHHITEGLRFTSPSAYFEYLSPELSRRFSGLEVGFHAFLAGISFFADLVLNYKFFPALWAVLSGLALFYVVYKKTENNFFISWLSLVFFASIKSNTNLLGSWFFTPLTFSVPIIFLYFYFFEKGIKEQNRKNILVSLGLMLFLLPFHPLSVLFSMPIILIYSAINYRFWWQEKILLFVFTLVGLFGIAFFGLILKLDFWQTWKELFSSLVFYHGWGVLETNNSFFELYNWLAWFLAFGGVSCLFYSKKAKENLLFLIWPAYLLIMVIFYKFTGVSIISPFQRNLFYLSIALPFLSALGLNFLIDYLKSRGFLQVTIFTFIFPLVFLIIFINYYKLDERFNLYRAINKESYQTLTALKDYEPSIVMADPYLSTALYPLSFHEPVGSIAFYGNRKDVENFYLQKDCNIKKQILNKHGVKYYIVSVKDKCDLGNVLIYKGGRYIYEFKP